MSKRDLEFLDKSIATAYSDSCSYITKGEAGEVCAYRGGSGWVRSKRRREKSDHASMRNREGVKKIKKCNFRP